MTTGANTQAITLPARCDAAFAFLAEPENLPRWAVGFARGIRREGGQWIVETAQGDVPVQFVTDPDRGTIDFHMTPADNSDVVAYSRVVPNALGSEYVFTQFQGAGMTDEAFAAQCAALTEELALLPILFRARAVCPIDGHSLDRAASADAASDKAGSGVSGA